MPEPIALSAELGQTIPFVWEKVAAFINKPQEKAGLLAAYAFELDTNLDLLDALKTEALSAASIGDGAFRGLVNRLHTEAAVSILYSTNRKNYRTFVSLLRKHLESGDAFTAESETDAAGSGVEAPAIGGVLEAMRFSIRKIEVLKSLAAIAVEGSELFPDYRLAVRIRNIRKALCLLKKCVSRVQAADE